MKTITLLKQWETEYSDAPEAMKLQFSDEDIAKIQKHIEYAKENNVSINYMFWSVELFNDEECEEESEFRTSAEYVRILSDGDLIFTAQSKWDSSLQFESDYFSLEDLENVFSNNDLQFSIERLKSFDPPITVSKATDENLEYKFAIDVEDESFWYENEHERDSDFEKLKETLTQFTFA